MDTPKNTPKNLGLLSLRDQAVAIPVQTHRAIYQYFHLCLYPCYYIAYDKDLQYQIPAMRMFGNSI